jgi:hypothetical protein
MDMFLDVPYVSSSFRCVIIDRVLIGERIR